MSLAQEEVLPDNRVWIEASWLHWWGKWGSVVPFHLLEVSMGSVDSPRKAGLPLG